MDLALSRDASRHAGETVKRERDGMPVKSLPSAKHTTTISTAALTVRPLQRCGTVAATVAPTYARKSEVSFFSSIKYYKERDKRVRARVRARTRLCTANSVAALRPPSK